MSPADIVQKLWNYCNVLRDDGMSYGDYVEQLTYLLFLKMADERTKPPYKQKSIVPKNYDWPSLIKKDGDELFEHYRNTLRNLGKEKGLLGLIFTKSQNKFQDPSKLRRLIVDLIDNKNWSVMSADVKGDAYEGLLEKNAQNTKTGAGQYFTPRSLIRAMVDVTDPHPVKLSVTLPVAQVDFFLPHMITYFNKTESIRTSIMTGSILSYRQKDSVKLLCEIDLKKLLPAPKQRERFNKKWKDFKESDPCNNEIFELEGGLLKYQSEQLIPSKPDDRRTPLLLVLGNPAGHSVKEGMFFSFEGNKKEHRFWKIMRDSKVLDLPYDENLSIAKLNEQRRNQLLNLRYDSPFRIGLCVFISMPSAPSGPWSGIAGVQKLIGAKAMRELEKEETLRIIECAKKFLSPNGVAVAFQKNAWNALRSDNDPKYERDKANTGKLKGRLKEMANIPLLCVPPTRLSGTCSKILRQLLEERGYRLKKNKEWRWLFYAQHHRLKTRLLDWTSNPVVALYFAVENILSRSDSSKNTYGAVWALHVKKKRDLNGKMI